MNNWIKLYYKDPENGQVVEYQTYAIDAHDAVRRYPDQYKLTPWDEAKPVKTEQPIRKTV